MEIFGATNSAPNTDVSIVAWFLENHLISAVFKKMKNPEQDLLVLFSTAWLLSTYPRGPTYFLLSSGALVGMASLNLP